MSDTPVLLKVVTAVVDEHVVATAHVYDQGPWGLTATCNAHTHGYEDDRLNGLNVTWTWQGHHPGSFLDGPMSLMADAALHLERAESAWHTIDGIEWKPLWHPAGPVKVTPGAIRLRSLTDELPAASFEVETASGTWQFRRSGDGRLHVRLSRRESWLLVYTCPATLTAGRTAKVTTEPTMQGAIESYYRMDTITAVREVSR